MCYYILEANGKTNTGEYVLNITNSIKDLNPKVFTSNDSFHKENAIDLFAKYGTTSYLPIKLFYYFRGWIRIFLYFLQQSKMRRCVLHTHWFRFSPIDYVFLILVKTFTNTKLVHTAHNLLPHEKKFFDYFFHRKLYKICDFVIFHNMVNKVDFQNLFNLDVRCEIVPHYSYVSKETAKDKAVENSILFFGNIRPYKNLELFLESTSNIEKRLYITVAGKPEYDINKLTIKYNRIHWILDWISEDELKEIFLKHQIVVLPYSKIDNSGLIHLAMSYEKAIIASDLPMFEEILGKNERGLLFKTGSKEDLKDKIEILLEDGELQKKLSKSAKDLMLSKHSLEKIGRELKKIYNSLN